MHVGLGMIFQNIGHERSDLDVYRSELQLADLAEPMGFQSVWTTEHHFTDYMLMPSPIQFLTYMAGRTKKIDLGSMVVVVPWHDPVRAAEDILMLDNMCEGRQIVGMGRGIARVEFDGFRLPLAQTRKIFVESAQAIIPALETGRMEFSGEFIKQPAVNLRPGPFKSFKGRTYASAVSPASMPIMANLGVGLLIVPQKPWSQISADLVSYRNAFKQVNGGREAPPPVIVAWTFVDEDEQRARELGRKYIGRYFDETIKHYEFSNPDLVHIPGYEYYADISKKIADYGRDKFLDFLVDLQVYGNPEACVQKIEKICRQTGADTFISVLSYGGMPHDTAMRNLQTFATRVKPALQEMKPISVAA